LASQTQSVTSVGVSPEDERRSRMVKYLIAMTVRVICIVCAVIAQGWLMWFCFAGAILLPYFAVVIANAQSNAPQGKKLTAVVAPTLVISADAFTDAKTRNDA